MTSVFTRIIDGELPGRFVWRDEHCVAFLTIGPVRPGHTLVVPRLEVDRWTDLPGDTYAHLSAVAHTIANAVQAAFEPARVGLLIAGFEVPHTHLHVIPMDGMADVDLSRMESNPDPAVMDDAAQRIRTELRAVGAPGVSD